MEVPEADLYGTLDQLRECEARILSVTPVRPTLEDYFIRLVGREQTPVHARGGDGPMSAMPGVVAINTFREAVRDRVLYNLVFFALMMIGAAILVGQISIGIERLVIINLGLSAISIFGLVMAVFIGVGLVYKEIEKRTLYSLLAKPIQRWEFLVGKYGGLLLTLLVNTSFMTLGLAAALYYVGRPFVHRDASILVAVYFILLELALVTALALFFSCFSSPMLSTLVYAGNLRHRHFRDGHSRLRATDEQPGAEGGDAHALLPGSELSQFQRDCGGGARRSDSLVADLAKHALRRALRRPACWWPPPPYFRRRNLK